MVTSLQGLCLQLPPPSTFPARFPQGFLSALEIVLGASEGLLASGGLLIHSSLDIPGCLQARLDGSVYPAMGHASVLAGKVDAALGLEELL